MKKWIMLALIAAGLAAGCKPDGEGSKKVPKAHIAVGETSEMIFKKLGEPNIDSGTQNSRVLIYDYMEIKLQSNIVVEVYDYR